MNTRSRHGTPASLPRFAEPSLPSVNRHWERWQRDSLWSAASLAGLLLLGWLGFQVNPTPFPAIPGTAATPSSIPLPPNLPVPVERFYRLIYGERIPVITSAIITGRATIRPIPGGPTLPARFRFIHEAGRNYRHYIEATWFGLPILRVNESYLDGVSRIELPWQKSEGNPQTAQAANLGLWAETTSMPAVFLTDPRVRWQAAEFVKRHRTELEQLPLSYFLVCTTLREDTAEHHREVLAYLDPVRAILEPLEIGLFAGRLDASRLPLLERMLVKAVKSEEGDWRDWEAIHDWAGGVWEHLEHGEGEAVA